VRRAAPAEPRPAVAPPATGVSPQSDPRAALHAHLSATGHSHLADAVEHSEVGLAGGDLNISTTRNYKLYFTDPAIAASVREVFGRALRLNVAVAAEIQQAAPIATAPVREDEARERALANPEVQRFQEAFPGSRVYKVRNLKE